MPFIAPPALADGPTLNAKTYGAKGNGSTDDAPAIQAMVNNLQSVGSGTIYFPTGQYIVRSAPVSLLLAKGINFRGDGGDNSILYGDGVPVVQTNGAWRCAFDGIRFQSLSAGSGQKAIFELDGNYDGTNHMGTQACIFTRCYFDAALLLPYAFALNRRGQSIAQGDTCAFYSCYLDSGLEANFYQDGYNTLNTTFVGGNFQSYRKNAVEISLGSANFYSVGFQGDQGWNMVVNGGYDISASVGGANDEIIMDGCRTESLRFFNGNPYQRGIIRGLNWTPPIWTWAPNTAVSLNTLVFAKGPSGWEGLFRVITAGTTGATPPAWANPTGTPPIPTTADNTVVWNYEPFTAINLPNGSISDLVGAMPMPNCAINVMHSQYPIKKVTAASPFYVASLWDETILADASGGAVTVFLPQFVPDGKKYTVKKIDTSANAVSVGCGGSGLEGTEYTSIPGGSAGYLNVVYSVSQNEYYLYGKG